VGVLVNNAGKTWVSVNHTVEVTVEFDGIRTSQPAALAGASPLQSMEGDTLRVVDGKIDVPSRGHSQGVRFDNSSEVAGADRWS